MFEMKEALLRFILFSVFFFSAIGTASHSAMGAEMCIRSKNTEKQEIIIRGTYEYEYEYEYEMGIVGN